MATPGWYPDPAGQPGAYRYWDGQAWGPDVTDNPFGGPQQPPPVPVAPTNPFDPMGAPTTPPGPPGPPGPDETVVTPSFESYEGYGQPQAPQQPNPQQGWESTPAQPSWASQPAYGQSSYGQPAAPGPQKSSGGKVVGIVLLALVLTVALGVGTFFVVRSFTGDDGESATDDPTSQTTTDGPTNDPTPDPTTGSTEDPTEAPTPSTGDDPVDPFTDPATPTARQCSGGRPEQGVTGTVGNQVTGGGLTMPQAEGYGQGPDQSGAFVFADGVTSTSKIIEQVGDTGWIAVYTLGGLTKANGFDSPGQAAGVVLECMAGSETFYNGLTGATILDSRLTTVDGAPAWVMDAEIRIDDPQLTVEGDIAKVVVVDTGDPERYGLFVSLAPIGDDALIAQQDSQQALLRLGG